MRTFTKKESYKVKRGYSVKVLNNNNVVQWGMVTSITNNVIIEVWLFQEDRNDTFPIESIIEVGKKVKPTF